MAACHSRCQVVSLDCSQSLREEDVSRFYSCWREKHGWNTENDILLSYTDFWIEKQPFCYGIKIMILQYPHSCDVHVGSMNILLYAFSEDFSTAKKWLFLCIFSVSSLWFCCIGFSVCNFKRLMTLSHTCEASLTKIQRRNVHSIFVSFFPFKRHSNQH